MTDIPALLRSVGISADPEPVPDWPTGEILCVEVPGAQAEELWRSLRERASESGVWPLILGDGADLLAESAGFLAEDGVEPDAEIDAAWDVDLAAWFDEVQREWEEDDEDDELTGRFAFSDWSPEGEDIDIDALGGHRESGELRETVSLWLVPAHQGWQVPARLLMGSWNDMPSPRVLVAVLRSWKKRFGADLFSVSHDRMEFDVQRPPTERTEVEALAREQYLFCADVVEQGYESVDRLASALCGARAWWLWWD